jgi:type IV pilus assembly protein PilC
MPAYSYRAVHSAGHVTRGTVAAANEQELAYYLNNEGFELIEAKEKKAIKSRSIHFKRTTSSRALTVFCAQMTDLLNAGIPFVDGLHDLAESMESGSFRDTLTDIVRAISHGSTISAAFARVPRLFPPVFIAILDSGEQSGDLAVTFAQLARYTESRARLNENLRRALRYPLFLLAVTMGVVTFMMTLVVPQIVSFLNSIDSELPFTTRILIAASHLVADGWWIIAGAFVALISLGLFLRRTSNGIARKLDAVVLRVPAVGAVINKLVLARFVQSLAILIQSGVSIPESLRGARDTLGNRYLEGELDEIGRQIQSGQALSVSMQKFFPPFAVRMLRIGEQSGQLSKSFNDIAVAYDREASEALERLIGSLEPALTLFVGAILGWIVLAVLGPIYGSLSKMNMM